MGTAIATLVRDANHNDAPAEVRYRQFWGAKKRLELLHSLDVGSDKLAYGILRPTTANRYSFRSGAENLSYESWSSLSDLSRTAPIPGMLEKRGGGLIGLDRSDIESRIRSYIDPAHDFDRAALLNPALATERADYSPRSGRIAMQKEGFKAEQIQPYLLYAFDKRWAYATPIPSIWNRSRPQLLHVHPDSSGYIVGRLQAIAEPEGFCTVFSSSLGDDYIIHKHAFLIPIIENLSGAPRPNLSDPAAAYLETIGFARDPASARLIWHHALAITYSPAYLAENAGGILQGWPRIPLPDSADALRASAALGARLAVLLDPDSPADGVAAGTIRPELRPIAVPVTAPGAKTDWRLAAWGTRTDKGITMPGRGRVETRPYTPAEAATEAHAATLGTTTHDIHLNATTFWRNIPQSVWECRIGGYQVLKKWLSYRDASIIDRPLTTDEVAHIQNTARRLAAILLLGPDLDASYRTCAASHRPLS